MVDPVTGGPHTAHTTNPGPVHLVDRYVQGALIDDGALRDLWRPRFSTIWEFRFPRR
jgi:2,3-bisphosphoglycerate-independent phosphoglycerate mutase